MIFSIGLCYVYVYLGHFVLDRSFWRRHKKKVFVSLGIAGSGYFLYKLYNAHKRRLAELEFELAVQRENDESIKAQLR